MVKQEFNTVRLIQNDTNLGFGRANNLAAATARGDYLFFLNSDTVVPKEALSRLAAQLNSQKPDLAGCRLLNEDGSLQPQGGALPNLGNVMLWMLNLDHLPLISRLLPPYQNRNPSSFNQLNHPGWIAGTAMIIKNSVFKQLQGFDPAIFMYAEDIDLCWRARKSGYSVTYWPQPTIVHLGQGSGLSQNAIIGEFKGLTYLFKKHYPLWQLPLLQALLKAGAFYRALIFAIIGRHAKSQIYVQAFKLG
jgi:hypothetical protein